MILVSGFLLHLLKAIILILVPRIFVMPSPLDTISHYLIFPQSMMAVVLRTSSLDHFLICRKGGLVVQHHNEIRDAIGDLAALAWGQVRRKTVVVEAGDQYGETLIADLCVHGVWLPQAEALFDIRVVDTDAQSYLHRTPGRVLLNVEVEKNKYADACDTRCTHFAPLCFSIIGLVGSEATCYLKRMACRLSTQWDKSFAEVLGWIYARLAFAILRAPVLYIHGSRTK